MSKIALAEIHVDSLLEWAWEHRYERDCPNLRTPDGRLWCAPFIDCPWFDLPSIICGAQQAEKQAWEMIEDRWLEGITAAQLLALSRAVAAHSSIAGPHYTRYRSKARALEMMEGLPLPILFFDRNTLDPTCAFCCDCGKLVNVEAERQWFEAREETQAPPLESAGGTQ